MTLLERARELLAEREAEKERIKVRRQAELDAVDVQIVALKSGVRKLLADPEIETVLRELTGAGLWPPK